MYGWRTAPEGTGDRALECARVRHTLGTHSRQRNSRAGQPFEKNGGLGRDWTADTRIFRPRLRSV